MRNLDKTLDAMRASLDKGKKLVEMGRPRFEEDWLVQDAARIAVIQLAEEAKRLPNSFREERGEIPWRKLIAMRNIVTHEHAGIDLAVVWEVLVDGFPFVRQRLFLDQ